MRLALFFFSVLLASLLHAQTPSLHTWHDSLRGREIPVAVYQPTGELQGLPVVVFSHGYGANQADSYLAYGYLTEALAAAGCFVVSIQHELPNDDLLNFDGPARVVRMPNWERGAANIHFVLQELERLYPQLDHGRTIVAGHSNGGDMSVLYSHQHPERVQQVITLDHRRMPILRASQPRTCTLRSSDQPADAEVLPTAEEAAQFNIRMIHLADTPHNNMDSNADPRQRAEIIALVLGCLMP
ncbi:MAG: alpha/beta hydrolase-fold protein [Flavobacteriales bacterium]